MNFSPIRIRTDRIQKSGRVILAISILSVFVGTFPGPVDTVTAAERDGDKNSDYVIQPGDLVFVSVWREETLQREVLVRPDGGLSFPLAGEVNAKGLTTQQLESAISKRLEKYIPDPVVTVSLSQNLGNRIYVVGKVNRPGEYVLNRRIDVMQALAMAGGMTPFADRDRIKILRRRNGGQSTFAFDYDQVEAGQRLSQNITLMPGDTVVVP
jgi:polysaccharide export outer membrane protein